MADAGILLVGGALGGALVTKAADFVLQIRAERNVKRQGGAALRNAARQVKSDLDSNIAEIDEALVHAAWPPRAEDLFSADRWASHQDRLDELGTRDWEKISVAFMHVGSLRRRARASADEEFPSGRLREAKAALEEARDALVALDRQLKERNRAEGIERAGSE